jgi:NADH-quinone oxidoreductase subunit F
MDRLMQRINNGRGALADIALLREVAQQIAGKCLCPLGEFSISAVVSGLELFGDDFGNGAGNGNTPEAS